MTTQSAPPDQLKRNSVGLPGVLMQSVTTISPAIAGLFTLPFIVLNAGVTAPLAYFGAFVIALSLGYVLSQFSRHISSVGSYYTFVARSLTPAIGIVVAWIYLLFYPVVVAQAGSFMGDVLEVTLRDNFNINIPWWVFVGAIIIICALTAIRGIDLSIKLIIVMGGIEILVVLVLAIWGFAVPGDGGINFDWVNPGNAPSLNGFALGVVFAIFALTGWDAAAPLAEEAVEPRRTVPRAVLGSIIFLGIFLVIASWGQITGWGSNLLLGDGPEALVSGEHPLPAFVLGEKFWGLGWIIVLLALLNSVIAVCIACTNSAVRFFLGLARAGVFPAGLAKIHPKYKTPINAVWLQTGISVVLGLILPLLIGVSNVYNVTGTWFTFALAIVYIVSNIGLIRFYWREHRDEFNWFKHVVVPVFGIIMLLVLVVFSLKDIAFPIIIAPIVVVVWAVIGVIVTLVIYRGTRKEKLDKAGYAGLDSSE